MIDKLDELSTWLDGIAKDVKSIDGRRVAVGLLLNLDDTVKGIKGLYNGGKLTVGELALIHEYGAGKNPPRSMVDAPLASSEGQAVIDEAFNVAFDKLWASIGKVRKSVDTQVYNALRSVGIKVSKFLQANMKTGGNLAGEPFKPLSDKYSTRKKKVGQPETPLDTTNKQLHDAISWEVE